MKQCGIFFASVHFYFKIRNFYGFWPRMNSAWFFFLQLENNLLAWIALEDQWYPIDWYQEIGFNFNLFIKNVQKKCQEYLTYELNFGVLFDDNYTRGIAFATTQIHCLVCSHLAAHTVYIPTFISSHYYNITSNIKY